MKNKCFDRKKVVMLLVMAFLIMLSGNMNLSAQESAATPKKKTEKVQQKNFFVRDSC